MKIVVGDKHNFIMIENSDRDVTNVALSIYNNNSFQQIEISQSELGQLIYALTGFLDHDHDLN